MAISLTDATGKHLVGLSSDDKPTDVDEGTYIHIVDTGEEYIFCDGMWFQDLRRINAIKMAAM